ncbi:DUF6220 domain-containing protein [Actinocatenispora thailandica]|nr:DUF6220 domain-containing protein [Actinocatenispora thailandica]
MAYRVVAYLIAAAVVVQAAAIAFALFGLAKWVSDGATANESRLEHATFTGHSGFDIHAVNGQMIIPVLAILLLIFAFFAHVRRGVLWGGLILLLVVVQVLLGYVSFLVPGLGALHAINALAIFVLAVVAARADAVPRQSSTPAMPSGADRTSA